MGRFSKMSFIFSPHKGLRAYPHAISRPQNDGTSSKIYYTTSKISMKQMNTFLLETLPTRHKLTGYDRVVYMSHSEQPAAQVTKVSEDSCINQTDTLVRKLGKSGAACDGWYFGKGEHFYLEISVFGSLSFGFPYQLPEYWCYFGALIHSAVSPLDKGLQLVCSFLLQFTENRRHTRAHTLSFLVTHMRTAPKIDPDEKDPLQTTVFWLF